MCLDGSDYPILLLQASEGRDENPQQALEKIQVISLSVIHFVVD